MNVNGRLEQSQSVSPSCSSSSPRVTFDRMTCGFHKARRISTCNSLLEPDFSLATEWLWYWEDEFGKWNLYASPVSRSGSSVSIKEIQHTAVLMFSTVGNSVCHMWQDGGRNPADVDSSVLERRFLSDADDVVKFKAHSQTYCLRFKGKPPKMSHLLLMDR